MTAACRDPALSLVLAGLPVRTTSLSLPNGHPLRARLTARRRGAGGQRWAWAWDGVD